MPARHCPSCRQQLPADQRFCGRCGADSTAAPTAAYADAPPDATETSVPDNPGRQAAPATSLPTPDTAPRFPTGTVIAGRYRIVGLLGRGGMGEVYRADDLKLARPVALKFLPGSVEQNPARLNRLLNEVRTALDVSHANVCRVHDVHQEAGRHFITMEFVDGDDLAALLRRIGRLPPDKALEIARQLCAGLGAAHAAGVLHRDLKPANLMIDGRGQLKITDFGLSGLIGDIAAHDVRAGTPAYMAPEQLEGKEVTRASDIYAMGLVLYEIFTGKLAYEGASAAELARARTSAPTSPSSHITDIDPAVERVILRCLEREPAERPRSALAVAAALPGGDPLAAALAAGETPAPELVAEAGAVGGLRPRVAWSLLATFVALLGLAVLGGQRYSPVSRSGLPKSRAVLQDKAEEILAALGYDEPYRDGIDAFSFNDDYLRELESRDPTPDHWAALERPQPAPLLFGYRRSPDWLDYESAGSVGSWLDRTYPVLPGEVRLWLDLLGRLVQFDAVPPEAEALDDSMRPMDWNALLAAAGLEESALDPVPPAWLPRRGCDERRAWEGVYPDAPDVPIRVEAAAYRGRPVSFRIVEPWSRPAESALPPLEQRGSGGDPAAVAGPLMFMFAVGAAGFVAWRNLRLGRGDRRTAVRFALAFATLRFLWYLLGHHVAGGPEFGTFTAHLAWTLYRFGLAYVFYLAIEPYARRLWPRMLTSWVRLFDGRFRDPLVGRDVLVGLVLGGAIATVRWLVVFVGERLGLPPSRPEISGWDLESLRGLHGALLGGAGILTMELLDVCMFVMLIFLMRIVMRRDALTLIPMLLLMTVLVWGDGPLVLALVGGTFYVVAIWFALFRVSFLGMVVTSLVAAVLVRMPLTFDLTAWWAGGTWIVLAGLLGVTGWSFRGALGGSGP
jgi:serine/threonine-protein kinase